MGGVGGRPFPSAPPTTAPHGGPCPPRAPPRRCWPAPRWPPGSAVHVRQQHVGAAARHRPGRQEGDGRRECGRGQRGGLGRQAAPSPSPSPSPSPALPPSFPALFPAPGKVGGVGWLGRPCGPGRGGGGSLMADGAGWGGEGRGGRSSLGL